VPAAVALDICRFTGLAAAGISEFQGGRAGLPVAHMTFTVLVLFTTCTGVFIDTTPPDGGNWFIVADLVCCLFWHCVYLVVRLPVL